MSNVFVDRFERATPLDEYTGDTGQWTTTTAGSSGMGYDTVAQLTGTDNTEYTISTGALPRLPSRGDTLFYRVQFASTTTTRQSLRFAWDGSGNGYEVACEPNNGNFVVRSLTSGTSEGTAVDSTVTYSTDTEYRIEVNYDDGSVAADTVQATLYEAVTSTQVSQVSISNTTHGTGDIEWLALADATVYLDAVNDQVETPQNLTSSVSGDDISLSWDSVTYADYYRVYRAEASGSTAGDYTSVGIPSGTTFSDTGLEDGERYYYRVIANSDGNQSAVSNETDETTALPAPTLESVSADEDDITVYWLPSDDSTDGNYELLRSTSGATGTVIHTESTLSNTTYVDTGLADGTTYYYTVRRNTDHVSDVDSGQDSATTELPSPTISLIGDDGNGRLTLSISNPSDVEVTLQVESRVVPGDWSDEGDPFSLVAGASTTRTTQQFLTTDDIDFRVEATHDSASALSGTVTQSGGTLDLPDGPSILLNRADGATRAVPLNRSPSRIDIDREYNTIGRWEADVALSDPVNLRAQWLNDNPAEVHLFNVDPDTGAEEYLFRGFFETMRTPEQSGLTTIEGRDILKVLTEGRATATYSGMPTHEVIEDYLTTYTDFAVDVTAPTPEEIATGELAQSANTAVQWEQITSFEDSAPVSVDGNSLQVAQTCWPVASVDMDRSGTSFLVASRFVDGEARELNSAGDRLSFDFTPAYDIPEEYVGVKIRFEADTNPAVDVSLGTGGAGSGTTFATYPQVVEAFHTWREFGDSETNLGDPVVGWQDANGGDLQAGESYTLTLEATSSGDYFRTDIVAVYDTRYDYTFDDTTDANNQLSGPALGPEDGYDVTLDIADVAYNITEARVEATFSDTSGPQAIAASNDGGTTFPLSVSNASVLDQSFDTSGGEVGTDGVVRFTLGAYGTQTDATPTEGYQLQSVTDYRLELTGNDLSVEDNTELRRSHYRNLLTLAERSDYRIVPIYNPTEKRIEAFPEGTSGMATWTALDSEREDDVRDVYDGVRVEGRQQDDGTYPTAELPSNPGDSAAIYDDKDPTLTTQAACESKARKKFAELQRAGRATGSAVIVPEQVVPGKSYPVEGWDPDDPPERSLQRVRYQRGIRPDGRAALNGNLHFEGSRGVRDPLIETRRETDRTQDVL